MHRTSKEWHLVGGLSEPSKMPCFGYSLDRTSCKLGMLMAKANPESICGKCYAKSGNYTRPNVLKAQAYRLQSIRKPGWIDAMVFLIKGEPYFRWHDSGDIQSIQHLVNIAEVARQTPNTKHWLPTREYQIVKEYIEAMKQIARLRKKALHNFIPDNLIIRLSASTFEGKAPTELAKKLGVLVSSVSKSGYTCPASHQENQCKDCRACWDKEVFEVTYKRHRTK